MATEFEPDERRVPCPDTTDDRTMRCFLRAMDVAHLLGGMQGTLHRHLGRLSRKPDEAADVAEDIDELLAAWQLLHAFPFEDAMPRAT